MSMQVHYYPRAGTLPEATEAEGLRLGPFGEAPRVGRGALTAAEFAHYLRQLAAEATRLAEQLDDVTPDGATSVTHTQGLTL